MRIALCLSGQPRTWRSTRASLMAFFAGHELDVFLHSWREGEPGELEPLVEAYRPRDWRFEERPLFVAEKRLLAERFPLRPALTMFDMFHSLGQSLALAAAAEGPAYDLVVRARFDAMFDGAWSGEVPGPGEIVVPDSYPDPASCNDQFALGAPAAMQAYAGVGAWLGAALPGLRGEWLRPELVLRQYLEQACGLAVALRPLAMRLCREAQAGQPFAALSEDPLFHAAKYEAWESFARERFPAVAAAADFAHPSRTALELDRALDAWLEARSAKNGFQLLKAPWPRRLRAVDAFIAAQAGPLESLDATSYRGVRMLCAALLQRMDRQAPLTLESFIVHALSANIEDMRRAAGWAAAPGRLAALPRAVQGLGPLARALAYANPLEQTGLAIWKAA